MSDNRELFVCKEVYLINHNIPQDRNKFVELYGYNHQPFPVVFINQSHA